MALFSKARRELRRKLRRPKRLAKRLRREVVKSVRLSRDTEKMRKEILELAKDAEKDKKVIKELRSNSAELVTKSKKYIDYFVKIFVDAEALVSDVAVNISMKLSNSLNRFSRSGFPKPKMQKFRAEFFNFTSKLEDLRKDIARLTRKAAKGRGGMSMSSTVHLQRQIRRAAKDVHGLRARIGDLFDDLHAKEEKLDVVGIENDVNSLFEKINQELIDIKVVANNNRILVKRFKDAFKGFSSKLVSAKIPDEQIKRVITKAVSDIEAYEDKALRQARRMARRQYRKGAAPARVVSATRAAA